MYYADDVAEELKNSRQLVIFGTGLVAFEAANCLLAEPYRLLVDFFMVSRQEENPKQVMGIPVVDLESAKGVIDKEAVIVIATMEKHLSSIREALNCYGYFHIISMTFESDLWSMIQGNYYKEYCKMCHKPYLTLEEELTNGKADGGKKNHVVSVYVTKCHADRKLQEDLSRFTWEIPIQAGAALTDAHICNIRDDTGENISHKNRQYCELTALYWIWKNDTSDYAGLCHYRRHFELNEGILKRLACSHIDVVLTIPILNFSSVREVYRHDHVERDWDVMLEAIRVLAPKYMAAAVGVQNGNFYFGYNMFIARKEILDDYCAWLFPILEYCEKRCGRKEDTYQERYIGFLAERLLTIYMGCHEKQFRIVHARKHFVGK